MLTLILSISGGLSWGEALLPLLPVGFTSTASFILFIDALACIGGGFKRLEMRGDEGGDAQPPRHIRISTAATTTTTIIIIIIIIIIIMIIIIIIIIVVIVIIKKNISSAGCKVITVFAVLNVVTGAAWLTNAFAWFLG